MRRRAVSLSPVVLDAGRDPVRLPPRPLAIRGVDYEDKFDFTTLFYDCFWSRDGRTIVLIGPPFLNLATDLDLTIVAYPSMTLCPVTHLGGQWITRAVVEPPPGTTALSVRTRNTEFMVAPQPNLCGVFAGRRVITTMSQDNELIWLRDWVQFHREQHGCDGVLIYDNNSRKYETGEIQDWLAPLSDTVEIVVLSWPFRYGLADFRLPITYGISDSFYGQPGMLEHARLRFLSEAAGVANIDVDELIVTAEGRSVFDLAATSETGLLVFDGKWIENFPRGQNGEVPRHRDFAFVAGSDQVGCEPKWVVVPGRAPDHAQWLTHFIQGMPSSVPGDRVELRHFKAIHTDWNIDRPRSQELRTESVAGDPSDFILDDWLRGLLDSAFATDLLTPAPVVEDERQRAYRLRLQAARLAKAGKPTEAARTLESALELLPQHPGFHELRASLTGTVSVAGAGQEASRKAEALRLADPWYHFQRADWYRDDGDIVAARAALSRAIELDLQFWPAYRLLAALQLEARRTEEAEHTLDLWRLNAPDHPIGQATLAAALEQRFRIGDALVHARRAIELDGTNPAFYALLARILDKAGEPAAAVQVSLTGQAHESMAVRMPAMTAPSTETAYSRFTWWYFPLRPELHADLAEVHLRMGDLALAEIAARAAVYRSVNDTDHHVLLGRVLTAMGRSQDAAAAFAVAIRITRADIERPVRNVLPRRDREALLVDRMLRHARALYASGDRNEAIAALQTARSEFPAAAGLTYLEADLLAGEGRIDDAVSVLRAGLAASFDNPDLRGLLSRILAPTDRPRAIARARDAVAIEPRQPYSLDHLATLLIDAGQYAEAAELVSRAMAGGFRSAALFGRQSQIDEARGDLDAAIEALRSAIELEPRQAYLREWLIRLLFEKDRRVEAETEIVRADAHGLLSAGVFSLLSRSRSRQGDRAGASAAAERAVLLEPDKAYLHDLLVQCLLAEGRQDDADRAVARGIMHAPDHAPLHYRRSLLLMTRNDAGAALAAAESAVRLSPAAAYLREHLIRLLLDLGRLDEAETQLGAAAAKGIASAQLSYLESRVLEARGYAEKALALAQRAADQAPDNAYLHERVAALSLQAKRLDEADAAIAAAIRLAPDRAGPHYQRSWLLRLRGDLPGAIAAATAAVAIEPGTGYIQDNLADALLSSDRLDEAEAVIAAALDLGVRHGPLHFRRSLLLLRRGDREAALNEARLAADIAPQAGYIRRHLERLLEEATPPREGAGDSAAVAEGR